MTHSGGSQPSIAALRMAGFAERDVTEYRRGLPRSLRLDVGRPDHFASLLGFIGDQFAEVGGPPYGERNHLFLNH
jgi:hypothetical protein